MFLSEYVRSADAVTSFDDGDSDSVQVILTPLLDERGTPLLGENGQPLYAENIKPIVVAPGGVNSWEPTSQATLVEWLRADVFQYQSSTAITDWTNSFGHDATGTATFLPSGWKSNRPTLRFNGTSDKMLVGSFPSQSQPFTLAFAFQYFGPAGGDQVMLSLNGAGPVFQAGGGEWGLGIGSFASLGTPDNKPHILFAVFNGASSKYSFDGGSLSTINVGAGSLSALQIGANGSLLFCNMNVSELIVFSGDGSSYYQSAANYLSTRWLS